MSGAGAENGAELARKLDERKRSGSGRPRERERVRSGERAESAAHSPLKLDLQSFEIQLEFESDNSDSIRKWQADSNAPAVVPQTTLRPTVQQIFNRLAVVIEIYFMFMILCLC